MRKRMVRKILISMGLFFIPHVACATTYVSGSQTGTWNLAGSPYVIAGDVIVPEGANLTINSGVIIKFATNTSLIAYGSLIAVGTSDGTITFTSNKYTPYAGDWQNIKLSGSGANGSQISYCLIQYAKQGVYLENVSGVVITNNYIHDNKGDNGLSGSTGQPGNVGAGIYLYQSNNNIISTNTIGTSMGGSGGNSSDESQTGGQGGIGVGIYLHQSETNTISGNTISNNTGGNGGTGGNHGSGGTGGIGAGIYLSSSTNNIISENIISSNIGGTGGAGGNYGGSGGSSGNGYGIYIDSSSFNNTIYSTNTYNGEPIHYYYGITTSTTISLLLWNYNIDNH